MAAKLAVEVTGSGEPLVLLHGIATDSGIWGPTVPAMSRGRRVVTVDLPGFGRSAPVDAGFDLDGVADRIARGLAAHRVRGPIDLVGHSLGGGVAIALAARRPRSVRRLLLVAPAGLRPFPAPMAGILAASADAFLRARRSAVSLTDVAWGRRLLMALTAADGATLSPLVARQMLEASATAARTGPALQAITTADLRPRLAATRMPLGVIWGEADLTVPIRALGDVVAARPDARVVRLAGAGHVPMVERPEAFVAALQELLDQLPVAASAVSGPSPKLLKDDTTHPAEAPIVP